jgi:hypothetical protein
MNQMLPGCNGAIQVHVFRDVTADLYIHQRKTDIPVVSALKYILML